MHSGTTIDELLAIVEAAERELNDSVCECGATLGEHAHDGHFCPNPADVGPLYLDTRYRDAETIAARLRDIDAWLVDRGANC